MQTRRYLRLRCLPLTLGLLLLPAVHLAAEGSKPGPPPETEQYRFKVGSWRLAARSMQPDRSLVSGTGTSEVRWIHGGRSLQDDITVTFEDGRSFSGTTFRTFDPQAGEWIIAYFPANSAAVGTGRGRRDGERMVETFTGEDTHGKYTDRLMLFDIRDDSFAVRVDRTYEAGNYLVEGVWQYRAERVK